ncbi:MAG: four helix bundle protein [Armatimonadota bacterium]
MGQKFDHEKLNVYTLELDFIRWLTPLLKESKEKGPVTTREIRDQLDRASISVVLNTAEGNGKRNGAMRRRFFDDARGSAMECAACLDILVAKGVTAEERIDDGKAMLLRIVQMLSKLIGLSGGESYAKEERVEYRVEYEGEDSVE